MKYILILKNITRKCFHVPNKAPLYQFTKGELVISPLHCQEAGGSKFKSPRGAIKKDRDPISFFFLFSSSIAISFSETILYYQPNAFPGPLFLKRMDQKTVTVSNN